MLNRLKGVVANSKKTENNNGKTSAPKSEKFVYSRPYFLGLNKDEVDNSRDFGLRPIFIPRNKDKTHILPFSSGYAECINGGKSNYNEDNSYACTLRLYSQQKNEPSPSTVQPYSSPVWPDNTGANTKKRAGSIEQDDYIEVEYFGVFDGHAGYHVSVIVSRLLHSHLQEKFEPCVEYLLQNDLLPSEGSKQVTIDDLVVGALEEAFSEMDDQLERERSNFVIKGGCTALVTLFLNNKLYIANAGDCRLVLSNLYHIEPFRAVLCHGQTVTQLTRDFNPESERQRINGIGYSFPELLYNEFSCIEFIRRLNKNDLGKRVLCRRPGMEGWCNKIVTEQDLKFPLVTGEGRKARLMGTIGVTRGLGDHDLYVYDTQICIKPFLTSKPEVTVLNLADQEWSDEDVLILGSDGLWDGVSKEEAASIVYAAIQPQNEEDNSLTRYTIAAQDLVCEARGVFTGRGWRKKDNVQASFDDITAFVIPIKPALVRMNQSESRSVERSDTKQNVHLHKRDGYDVDGLGTTRSTETVCDDGHKSNETSDDIETQDEVDHQLSAQSINVEKVNMDKENAEQINRGIINIEQLETEQVNAKVNSDQENTDHTNTEQINLGQVNTEQVKADHVKDEQVSADRVNTEQANTDQVNTEQIKANITLDQVNKGQGNTDKVNPEEVNAGQSSREQIDTNVNSEQVNDGSVNTK